MTGINRQTFPDPILGLGKSRQPLATYPQRYNGGVFQPKQNGLRESITPTQMKSAKERSRPQVQRITEQVLLTWGQMLVVGALAIAWEIVANAFGWTEFGRFPLVPAGPQIINACIAAGLGFFSALLIIGLLPGAVGSGRWVWLPPFVLLALLIGRDVLG
jgi:hypothetical protein